VVRALSYTPLTLVRASRRGTGTIREKEDETGPVRHSSRFPHFRSSL